MTGKSLTKFWKTVYGKIFRKPFSFQNTHMLYSALPCSLFFFFASAHLLCLCFLPLLSAQLCRATPSRPFLAQPTPSHPELAFPRTTPPPRAGPDALCLCSFLAPSLYHPRSGPDEVVCELMVEGGAVGLELGSELVVEGGVVGLELGSELLAEGGAGGLLGLWVCDGGFVEFFMVVCGGLRWWICTCSGFAVSDFYFYFYFYYYYLFFFHFTLLQTL